MPLHPRKQLLLVRIRQVLRVVDERDVTVVAARTIGGRPERVRDHRTSGNTRDNTALAAACNPITSACSRSCSDDRPIVDRRRFLSNIAVADERIRPILNGWEKAQWTP